MTALALAALAWIGLGLQLYLVLVARWHEQASLLGGLIAFFSYFTVLSNTLAAAVLTAIGSGASGGIAARLRRPGMTGLAAASIVLVGTAYSLLLRNLWDPQGLQWIANEILHDVMPVLFVGYWLAMPGKGSLRAWHLALWSLYPALYFAWVLVRGDALKVYPYPFVDVTKLGYGQVWINASGVLIGFLLIGALVILLDRCIARRTATRHRAP